VRRVGVLNPAGDSSRRIRGWVGWIDGGSRIEAGGRRIEVEIRGRAGGASDQSCGGEERRKGRERRCRWLPAGHGGGGAQ
jgi:hypothetical protein